MIGRPASFVVALLLIAVDAAHGQATPTSTTTRSAPVSIGFIRLGDEGSGLALAAGYSLARKYGGVQLQFIDAAILPHDNSGRYRSETFSDGQRICRDTENGQFAEMEHCAARFVYGVAPELYGRIRTGDQALSLGAGVRIGRTAMPYGFGTLTFDPTKSTPWFVRVRAGDELLDMVIGAELKIR